MNKRKLQRKKRGKRRVKSKIVPFHSTLAAFISLFVISHSSSAQDFDFSEADSWEISASNQLEYSLNRKTHQDILHNWFDFSWTS